MALSCNFPPASGHIGVDHALSVTGLELFVRRTKVRFRSLPLISLNLLKFAHF